MNTPKINTTHNCSIYLKFVWLLLGDDQRYLTYVKWSFKCSIVSLLFKNQKFIFITVRPDNALWFARFFSTCNNSSKFNARSWRLFHRFQIVFYRLKCSDFWNSNWLFHKTTIWTRIHNDQNIKDNSLSIHNNDTFGHSIRIKVSCRTRITTRVDEY